MFEPFERDTDGRIIDSARPLPQLAEREAAQPAPQPEGEFAPAVAVGITRGANIIRVHDVAYMARVARMTDAIVRGK